MRENLCSVLACPVCGKGEWSLAEASRDYREFLSGTLTCRGCGRAYLLKGGAVEFLSEEELGELRRTDRDNSAESDRIILERKRRGNFVGELRQREDEYRCDTVARTEFFFHNLEYDTPHKRYVVDLGCGEPLLASRFVQLGFNVIALDFVFARLDTAHGFFEREGTYFERVAALMTRLPLRDQSMDIVFSHASLHHATPHRAEDFRWFDPRNMLDTLREVRRVLNPNGLFLVSGEGIYDEGISDEERWLEHKAQETGCYEAFYKMSEYEWAFREAGVSPSIWATSRGNRLGVATFVGGRYREIVTPDDAVSTLSDLLISAPAVKRELDACLKGWARVRPWPGATKVLRKGGLLPVHDTATFVRGWHQVEADPGGVARWMGRDPAVIAFELELVPAPWSVELEMRACSVLGPFRAVVFVEQQGRIVAREVLPASISPATNGSELVFETKLEAGHTAIRCIRDGQMRVGVCLNGDLVTTLEAPSDNEFHTYRVDLPPGSLRALNQLTLLPSYALRPSDCDLSPDDRWLSCFVRDVKVRLGEGSPAPRKPQHK